MLTKNELTLVNDKALRDQVAGRVEVLDKVKKLLLLPKLNMMTSAQVAGYYEVSISTLKNCYSDNKAEIDEDGTALKKPAFWKSEYPTTKDSARGSVTFQIDANTTITVPNAGIRLFSRRAVLRIGMLLRDSPIAQEVRTQLLNTAEHATDEQKTAEIDNEKQLLDSITMAFAAHDSAALIQAAMNLDAYRCRHINQLTEQVEVLEPKGKYYDHVLQAEDLTPITVIAKDYGWSAIRMNNYLKEKGVQFKRNGTWVLYQRYADKGYTGTKTYSYIDSVGLERASINTFWTQVGRLFIYDLLKQDGVVPMMERDA